MNGDWLWACKFEMTLWKMIAEFYDTFQRVLQQNKNGINNSSR